MGKLNLAAGIFVVLALLGAAYGVDIALRHGFDDSWPAHARYHLVVSGLHLVTLSLLTGAAAIGGLRRRRRAAWVTLAIVAPATWAAWPLARLVAGQPPPGWVQLLTLGAVLMALFALAISFRPIFDGDRGPSRPSAPPIGE